MNPKQKHLLLLILLMQNAASFKTIVPTSFKIKLNEGFSGEHATDTYFKTPFNPPNNCHNYEFDKNTGRYILGNGDSVSAGNAKKQYPQNKKKQSVTPASGEPGRRFDVLKQMDALHQVGNENEVRNVWRESRKVYKGIDDNFFEGCTIPETNKFYMKTERLLDDSDTSTVPQGVSSYSQANSGKERRLDDTRRDNRINEILNYSQSSSQETNFGRRTRQKNDNYQPSMQDTIFKGRPFDENNKIYDSRRNVELSQRISRAMDPYDPYHEQERFDERRKKNIKEYEGRATDLETRLESFKDYTNSRKQQNQMEEYVFPSQFGPQNPYKHFDEEDGDTDAMRDLEEDLLKSPNPYKQNRDWTQDVHDSSVPENTEMKIEDVNDITMNLSSASIQGNDSPDNMEGSGENEQMNRLEQRLMQMELRFTELLDRLDNQS